MNSLQSNASVQHGTNIWARFVPRDCDFVSLQADKSTLHLGWVAHQLSHTVGFLQVWKTHSRHRTGAGLGYAVTDSAPLWIADSFKLIYDLL